MPRIVFKNIEKDAVKILSQILEKSLADIIDCPADWITFEHIENRVFYSGIDITQQNIIIEISWFKRSQDIQDRVAAFLDSFLRKQYITCEDITIIFYELQKENYYEKGSHY